MERTLCRRGAPYKFTGVRERPKSDAPNIQRKVQACDESYAVLSYGNYFDAYRDHPNSKHSRPPANPATAGPAASSTPATSFPHGLTVSAKRASGSPTTHYQ